MPRDLKDSCGTSFERPMCFVMLRGFLFKGVNVSNIVDYAKNELDLLGRDEDGIQDSVNKNILDIIEIFAEQGHSGFTAGYVLGMLERLLRWKPIKPLTGEEDEWNEPNKLGRHRQNKRCGSVFLDENGIATDLDEFMVSDNGGITWFSTNKFERTPITFPYTPPVHPRKIYIEYTDEENNKFDVITDDQERIKALYERKRAEFDGIKAK